MGKRRKISTREAAKLALQMMDDMLTFLESQPQQPGKKTTDFATLRKVRDQLEALKLAAESDGFSADDFEAGINAIRGYMASRHN